MMKRISNGIARSDRVGARGAVLLEVVLALVLFAAAATVIGIALNSSLSSVERLRLGAQAGDLAVTVFSELQLGIRSLDQPDDLAAAGTNAWTVELVGTSWGETGSEAQVLTQVEVTLRHRDGYVHRAAQVMKLRANDDSLLAKAQGQTLVTK